MWAFNYLPTERIISFNYPSALRALEIKLGHLFYVLSLPSVFQIEYDAPRQNRAAHSQDSYLVGGAAKSLCRNMNMKVRRVCTTRRTIVFHFCSWISGLSDEATIRCCVTSAVGAHPCARQFCVALHRGRKAMERRPYRCGDRPGGRMPAGMSKSRCVCGAKMPFVKRQEHRFPERAHLPHRKTAK